MAAKVEDVLQLCDYSEGSLVDTLSARFEAHAPYTYAGSILLALNPYQWLDELYGKDVRRIHHRPSLCR